MAIENEVFKKEFVNAAAGTHIRLLDSLDNLFMEGYSEQTREQIVVKVLHALEEIAKMEAWDVEALRLEKVVEGIVIYMIGHIQLFNIESERLPVLMTVIAFIKMDLDRFSSGT